MENLNKFGTWLAENEKSNLTIEKYLRDVKAFLFFCGDNVSRENVLRFKEHIGSEYEKTSANSMIAAVNCWLKYSGKADLCVRQFRIQKKPFSPEEKELSREEYSRLVRTAERNGNERLSLVIQTICGTGIRVSELQYITVEAVRKGEAVVSCKNKTRTVFIVKELRKKLLSYAQRKRIRSGYIFVTRNGLPLSRTNVWREMKNLCRDARVNPEKVFPHNLRHLFARVFYSMEKDIAKLADILGHSSINTTRIYIISTGAEHRRQMEKMHLIL